MGRGGAAAAPRPGKKPARCGFGSVGCQRGGDSSPSRPTPPPRHGPAPLRPRRPKSRSPRSRFHSRPVAVPDARRPPAVPRSQCPERPRWRGASSRSFCTPSPVPGLGLSWEPLALSEPARPRVRLGAERRSECQPT